MNSNSKINRGDIISIAGHGNYIVVRESRPAINPITGAVIGFFYNLVNIATGKMRWTINDRAYADNEPIMFNDLYRRVLSGTKKNLSASDFKSLGHISDAAYIVKEFITDYADADSTADPVNRGDILIATDGRTAGNPYMLIRESRPAVDPITGNTVAYYYNLLNMFTGKVRVTDGGKAYANNEPISMQDLSARFDIGLVGIPFSSVADKINLSTAIFNALKSSPVQDAIDMMWDL